MAIKTGKKYKKHDNLSSKKCVYDAGYFEKIIWIVVHLISSLTINITDTEILYEICPMEASFIICSTSLLLYALKFNRIEFLIPWSILTANNIYYNKIFAMEYLLSTHYYEIYGNVASFIASFLLGLKLFLWIRIFQFIIG